MKFELFFLIFFFFIYQTFMTIIFYFYLKPTREFDWQLAEDMLEDFFNTANYKDMPLYLREIKFRKKRTSTSSISSRH